MSRHCCSWRRLGHPLVGILGAYCLLCGALLPWFLHRLAPDAVSYLTIARKYRAWEFHDAVNGYWSPLFSLLVAPLLCLAAPADVTAKLLQVAIGAVALAVVWWLGKRLELPHTARAWTTFCLIPAVAMYALTDTTPDLLVAVILAGYIGVVIGKDYPCSVWQGAACGLLGAFAYLAKAYAFPFFVVHFLAVSGYLFLQRRSRGQDVRRLAAATAIGLLVFAVVAGGWAGLLSRKYSRFTIGTTGAYQLRLRGGGHATEIGGLYPPANGMAVSAWEDPSDLNIPDLPPAASAATPAEAITEPAGETTAEAIFRRWPFIHSLYRIYRNGVRYVGTLFRLSLLAPCILAGLLVSCWIVPRGVVRDRLVILLGTMILYPAGYLLIFVNERFFWLITFLLSVTAGMLTTTLPVLKNGPGRTRWAIVVALSATLWPAWVLARLWHHVLEETPAVAAALRPIMPPGTKIASDAEWGITNSIAFYLDAAYYGRLRPDASPQEQQRQLRVHRIQYLLLWGDPSRYPFLASAREVPFGHVATTSDTRWPRIYELPASRKKPRSTGTKPEARP